MVHNKNQLRIGILLGMGIELGIGIEAHPAMKKAIISSVSNNIIALI